MTQSEAKGVESHSMEYIRSAFDLIDQAVIITNNHFLVSFLNQAACQVFATPKEYAIGRPLEDVIQCKSSPTFCDEVRSILQKQGTWHSEAECTPGRGKPIRVSWTIKPFTLQKSNSGDTISIIRDITEECNAINELQELEERFRLLYENSPIPYQSLDEKGIIIEANQAWLESMGYQRHEVIGRNFGDYLPNDFKEVFKKRFRQFLKVGLVLGVEFEMIHKKGTVKHIVLDGRIGHYPDGLFRQTHCVFMDVTERRLAETALRESEERYREFVEGTDDLITQVDSQGNFTFVNHAARKIFGLEPEECIGKSAFSFIHPEDQKRTMEQFSNWVRDREPSASFENRQVNRNGQLFDMLWTINLHFDDQGNITVLNSIARDITESKKAERELKDRENQLQAIFRAAPMGLGLTKNRGISWVNERLCKMTGYDASELQGQSARILYADQEDFERVGREKYALIEQHGTGSIETRLKRKDGRMIDVILSSTPLDPDDRSAGVTFTALDITDRVLAQKDLAKYRDHLEQMVKERTVELQRANELLILEVSERKRIEEELRKYADTQEVLVREVNHRVKNNLFAIISMLHKEMHRATGNQGGDYEIALRDLIARIEGLSTVHSLLSLSGWRPLNAKDLCEQVIHAAIKGSPLEKQIKVTVHPTPMRLNSSQAHHLTLVINELATNSVKHALKSSDSLTVTVAFSQEDGKAQITFRDDGPGYPPEVMENGYRSDSIGFDLIRGIVAHSLAGSVRLYNDAGGVTIIEFENEIEASNGESV